MPTLTADLREALRDRFRDAFGERLHRLILYGSHARDEATKNSDIDLLVVLEGRVNRKDERRAQAVKSTLFEPGLSPLSILTISADEFATRNLPLYRNVRAEGQLLFPENDPVATQHLRTHSYPHPDTASGLRPESEAYFERARTRLDSARNILERGGDIALAVSAAYYTMFLAATAALNEADLAAKSQQETITLFSKHYVKEGPLDDSYGHLLGKAQDKRIDADYARTPSISQSEATQWLDRAEDFVDTVEAMLLDAASRNDTAS
jgi:uncharacterized protein (UPF0332 family)/predicted nucleotidyltransferase